MMTTATYDWHALVEGLNQYLRLRSIPIEMKLFETVEEMEAIPKIRRPKPKHTTDQIVAPARQRFLPKTIEGLAALSKNGLRYPIPPYGIQAAAAAGLAVSYSDKDRKGA